MSEKKKKRIATWWTSMRKSQQVTFILSGTVSLFVLLFVFLTISVRELGLNDLADSAFGPGKSGWQVLSEALGGAGLRVLLTFVILGVAITVNFLVNFLVSIFTWRGKRSRTIGSLVKSLFRYLVFLLAAGFIMSAWGVDVTSIVASLGVVTLIVGLGCQSLISDIVSGVFLVIDDFFDVGDIVVIDSFRGTITEIGLRSTKLTDWAGNIKAINNSQINTVINLSRLATTLFIIFTIDGSEDLQRAESVIIKSLPIIEKALPKVIGTIEYRGVTGLEESGIQLAFLANCQEDDRYQVTRDVKRELYLLMRRNNIKVPFHKIFVQNEEEREGASATEEEKVIAENANEANRDPALTKEERDVLLGRANSEPKEKNDEAK